jgi:hypothetical protein
MLERSISLKHIYTTCALPGCNKPTKSWRTHFCCNSHGVKYSHLDLPKLTPTYYKAKSKQEIAIPKKYKDRTPEQKGKWVAYVTARQKRIKKATPRWTDVMAIKQFYVEAQRLTKETGIPHKVDHIIPIQGKLVSGLHVPANLQILTEKENQIKNAKFTV